MDIEPGKSEELKVPAPVMECITPWQGVLLTINRGFDLTADLIQHMREMPEYMYYKIQNRELCRALKQDEKKRFVIRAQFFDALKDMSAGKVARPAGWDDSQGLAIRKSCLCQTSNCGTDWEPITHHTFCGLFSIRHWVTFDEEGWAE
ncbi:MAG: hypothetical protein KJ970_13290 [Candidatus Eisenbacteria bacterium]|uniref:Uncharacterized protein n=1 Tax=Eiseniibacteriota bacterium TaxID=2212470 RepID=A0A948RYF8_UNCEI|nr:hypothetical protein [Candidatus Eisenbacteria bacterium]MBU1947891.1 hypothetical protein [Candidatus Eisenbacteria bacterium]MBU2691889.1 hypothetical protein [Candidatus Eisenbacteria bacterium]